MSKDNTSKQFTRGGQIAFHNLRMFFQINKGVLKVLSYFFIVLSIGFCVYFNSFNKAQTVFTYYYACMMSSLGLHGSLNISVNDKVYELPYQVIEKHAYFKNLAQNFEKNTLKSIGLSVLASLMFCFFLGMLFVKKGKDKTQERFVRGGAIKPSSDVKRQIEKEGRASPLLIDGFPMIEGFEVQHSLIHGTIGTGKSQLIMKFLDHIRSRGDRVIIYDKGCSFTKSYFDGSKDVLLNPFDSRCASWDLWEEAPEDEMLENLAESLIPMHGEQDPFWVDAARTVFTSTASKMRNDPDRSIEKLIKLLVTGEFSELEPYLVNTPAATLVSGKIEKTAVSIRSILTTYLKSLMTLSGLDDKSNPFSIRKYIQNPTSEGWLFISSNGEQHKSLKPLISMWIAMASLTLLSLTEDRNRRIWFICDELPSLHKLPLLGETIAEVRKFGGCFMLGMQNFSQLAKVYGRNGAAEIFDLLNTRFFFRSPSAEMAKLVSQELGQEEVDEVKESTSYGANSIRDGVSLSTQRMTKNLISYTEIMELPNLSCFARLPGNYPITKLELSYQDREQVALPFIKREIIIPQEDSQESTVEDETQNSASSFDFVNQLKSCEKNIHRELV